MGIANIINVTGSAGGVEIIRELSSSSDGQGLHFEGSSGYVSCGDSTILDGATELSLEVILSTTSTTEGRILAKQFDSIAYALRNDAAGTLTASIGNGLSNVNVTTSGTYNDGALVHVVVTWDNADIKIYANGNLDGTGTLAGGSIQNTADFLELGSRAKSGSRNSFFNGSLYRARIYNKALTQAEVDTAYQRADVPFADQYGSETDLVNANSSGSGTAWTGATGVTPPTGWSAAGSSRTYTIDAGTGDPAPSLKIEAGSANVGIKWGSAATLGKKHRVTFSYKCGDAATTMAYRLNDADSFVNLDNSTTWATKTVEWTGDGVTGGFMLRVNESGKFGHVDTVSIRAIGAVTDYDLAFANPTQSLIVQDRAGAADGTASASGVSQTQPIVQLNSTSARIGGGTAITPADNELVAGKLRVYEGASGATADTTADALVIDTDQSQAGISILTPTTGAGNIFFGDTGDNNAGRIEYAHASNTMEFRTAGTSRLKIDSSGVVNIPNLSASSDVQTDGSSNLITSSDKRLKNDLGELTAGLDIISNLQPHYFSWKNDETNTQQLGFYAQDVYEFLPEAAPREEVTNEDGSTDYKWGFNGRPIIAALVASVKELKAKVEALENA